jgi:5-formyltetrahydrofolate cyclo-ligase
LDQINQQKAGLRHEMRARLAEVALEQQQSWSREIIQWLMSDESWLAQPGAVALFGGIRSEPDLRPLFAWLNDRERHVAFFAVEKVGLMRPHRVCEPAHLMTGVYGVSIPDVSQCPAMREEELAAVLVPGLAFSTRDGTRLGRGKGYYDRILARLRPDARVIGIAFAMQMLNEVPRLPHDRCMDSLVCENGWRAIPK